MQKDAVSYQCQGHIMATHIMATHIMANK